MRLSANRPSYSTCFFRFISIATENNSFSLDIIEVHSTSERALEIETSSNLVKQ
jgi:hypothetical protein